MSINLNNFILENKNLYNYYFDKSKVKLLKNSNTLKIQDLKITSTNKNKIILNLDNFSFDINKELIYKQIIKNGMINNDLNFEMPVLEITLTIQEIEKIIDLISIIQNGIYKISTSNSNKDIKKEDNNNLNKKAYSENDDLNIERFESYNYKNIKIDNIKFIMEDKFLLTELFDFSFLLKSEEKKFLYSKVEILIKPINLIFMNIRKNFYNSHLLSRSLIINFENEFSSSSNKLEIFVEKGFVYISDENLLEIIKFIGKILYLFSKLNPKREEIGVNKVNNSFKKDSNKLDDKNNQNNKSNKEIQDININEFLIFFSFEYKNLFLIKVPKIIIKPNELIVIEKLNCYFKNLCQFPSEYNISNNLKINIRKIKFIKIKNIFIKFQKNNLILEDKNNNDKLNGLTYYRQKSFYLVNSTEVSFENLELNIFINEMLLPFIEISNYFQFFPYWVEYNINSKDQEVYQSNFTKDDENKDFLEHKKSYKDLNDLESANPNEKNIFKLKIHNIKCFINEAFKILKKPLKDGELSDYSINIENVFLNTVNYKEEVLMIDQNRIIILTPFYFFNLELIHKIFNN